MRVSFRNVIIMDILIDDLDFCGGCNATYYGKVRICEHFGISYLSGKKMKIESNKVTEI